MSLENSQIARFFQNQTIFLTGGTGLLGKLLIEKLLRTCWNLKKIYVLMRPKSGKTAQKRFEELFDNPCFDLIKHKPVEEKVFLIGGDCQQPGLGLSPEDAEMLKNETSCVFHVAANVRFDLSLKEASHNVTATRDILQLAQQIANLKVFVYISTAYSNCIHSHIREDFYEPPMKPRLFLDLVDQVGDDILQEMTPALLGKWPNTYVYTKAISEGLLKSSNSTVPTAIVRPSIIMNTLEEPIKGWIDNCYGVIGVILGANVGVVRSYHANKNNKLCLVPADHVCNCILAAAWKTAQAKTDEVIIYNCVGTPTAIERTTYLVARFYWEFPSDKYMWYKSFKLRDSKFWHDLCVFSHLIPAYLIDFVFFFLGKPTKIVRRYKYINKVLELTSYFAKREWIFDQDNVTDLWKDMSDDDRKIFNFNTTMSDWYKYSRNCALGIRLYLLKDPIDTLPQGRRKLNILFAVHYVVVGLLFYFLFLFLKFVFGLF